VTRPGIASALLAAALLAGGTSARAQALSCALPMTVPVPRRAEPGASEPVRRLPIAAYTLALTWSPQYCRDSGGRASFQCAGAARFGFVLHGLWPDGRDATWPQYCRPAALVPARVIRDTLCTTPSADLIQHEWAKHGTCGWGSPAAYFNAGRRLYEGLHFPDMTALSRRDDLTVGELRGALVRANPGLTGTAVRIRLKPGNWLEEVWLCLDMRRTFARCSAGQGGGAAARQRVRIWRGPRAAPAKDR
jgi:ribonuclease T2